MGGMGHQKDEAMKLKLTLEAPTINDLKKLFKMAIDSLENPLDAPMVYTRDDSRSTDGCFDLEISNDFRKDPK